MSNLNFNIVQNSLKFNREVSESTLLNNVNYVAKGLTRHRFCCNFARNLALSGFICMNVAVSLRNSV